MSDRSMLIIVYGALRSLGLAQLNAVLKMLEEHLGEKEDAYS